MGRYITQDPVGLAGELNGYAYADGDPVGWADPLGLSPLDKNGFDNI
ncbi:RHS repeat-associated core domain-containing protein [Enterobacter soli]|nr:RHS repeat-associated core domain-containing protein [Enterobacter soli]